MSLKNKNAVIYGAGGAIGSKVARALGRGGCKGLPYWTQHATARRLG